MALSLAREQLRSALLRPEAGSVPAHCFSCFPPVFFQNVLGEVSCCSSSPPCQKPSAPFSSPKRSPLLSLPPLRVYIKTEACP